MQTLRIKWLENGQERCLYLLDPDGTPEDSIIDFVYAAANEVHIPIGPGAFDCQFEKE